MFDSMNIAQRLDEQAERAPDRCAVAWPLRRGRAPSPYGELTFSQLQEQTDRIAAGLIRRGVTPGKKLALFVPFGVEFIALTYALFKTGAVVVLIDPGMGRKQIFRCLDEAEPDGFIAVPLVHLVRLLSGRRFASARWNVSTGMKLPGARTTYAELLNSDLDGFQPVRSAPRDPAAVIFTSGSTGPAKGVLYEHGMFNAQVDLIQRFYDIQPGEIDLPGFPLFGLFNAAMGVTTIIPDMNPTRPAQVDPVRIVHALTERKATQAFGSPAFWNRVGRYCEQHGITLPGLRRALSAGGPVPVHVLERMSRALTGESAEFHTPYGATESLPVASISAKEILQSAAEKTRAGGGACVGRRFPEIEVKIIAPVEGEIASLSQARELSAGEIGEIIVSGPPVTREYFLRPQITNLAKIPDGDRFWHRIGDVGYLDQAGLLWFCGRKSHIVHGAHGPMYSICCEAIFNQHPRIYRSALVGIESSPGQRPVIVAEPEQGAFPESRTEAEQLKQELLALGRQSPLTESIQDILLHRSLPVDARHNVKINREALSIWAGLQLARPRG